MPKLKDLSRPFAAFVVAAALSLPAAAQDNPIVARMKAFAEAYNAADAAAVSAFYTEAGALLPPRAAALVGREAIAAHYAAAFEGGVKNLRVDIKEIRGHGTASAVMIGETAVDLNDQSIQGRFLHVWILVDNQWYLSRDMYHVLAVK